MNAEATPTPAADAPAQQPTNISPDDRQDLIGKFNEMAGGGEDEGQEQVEQKKPEAKKEEAPAKAPAKWHPDAELIEMGKQHGFDKADLEALGAERSLRILLKANQARQQPEAKPEPKEPTADEVKAAAEAELAALLDHFDESAHPGMKAVVAHLEAKYQKAIDSIKGEWQQAEAQRQAKEDFDWFDSMAAQADPELFGEGLFDSEKTAPEHVENRKKWYLKTCELMANGASRVQAANQAKFALWGQQYLEKAKANGSKEALERAERQSKKRLALPGRAKAGNSVENPDVDFRDDPELNGFFSQLTAQND